MLKILLLFKLALSLMVYKYLPMIVIQDGSQNKQNKTMLHGNKSKIHQNQTDQYDWLIPTNMTTMNKQINSANDTGFSTDPSIASKDITISSGFKRNISSQNIEYSSITPTSTTTSPTLIAASSTFASTTPSVIPSTKKTLKINKTSLKTKIKAYTKNQIMDGPVAGHNQTYSNNNTHTNKSLGGSESLNKEHNIPNTSRTITEKDLDAAELLLRRSKTKIDPLELEKLKNELKQVQEGRFVEENKMGSKKGTTRCNHACKYRRILRKLLKNRYNEPK